MFVHIVDNTTPEVIMPHIHNPDTFENNSIELNESNREITDELNKNIHFILNANNEAKRCKRHIYDQKKRILTDEFILGVPEAMKTEKTKIYTRSACKCCPYVKEILIEGLKCDKVYLNDGNRFTSDGVYMHNLTLAHDRMNAFIIGHEFKSGSVNNCHYEHNNIKFVSLLYDIKVYCQICKRRIYSSEGRDKECFAFEFAPNEFSDEEIKEMTNELEGYFRFLDKCELINAEFEKMKIYHTPETVHICFSNFIYHYLESLEFEHFTIERSDLDAVRVYKKA